MTAEFQTSLDISLRERLTISYSTDILCYTAKDCDKSQVVGSVGGVNLLT